MYLDRYRELFWQAFAQGVVILIRKYSFSQRRNDLRRNDIQLEIDIVMRIPQLDYTLRRRVVARTKNQDVAKPAQYQETQIFHQLLSRPRTFYMDVLFHLCAADETTEPRSILVANKICIQYATRLESRRGICIDGCQLEYRSSKMENRNCTNPESFFHHFIQSNFIGCFFFSNYTEPRG